MADIISTRTEDSETSFLTALSRYSTVKSQTDFLRAARPPKSESDIISDEESTYDFEKSISVQESQDSDKSELDSTLIDAPSIQSGDLSALKSTVSKSGSKSATKSSTKSASKSASKSAIKSATKSASKSASKSAIKSASKSASKSSSKSSESSDDSSKSSSDDSSKSSSDDSSKSSSGESIVVSVHPTPPRRVVTGIVTVTGPQIIITAPYDFVGASAPINIHKILEIENCFRQFLLSTNGGQSAGDAGKRDAFFDICEKYVQNPEKFIHRLSTYTNQKITYESNKDESKMMYGDHHPLYCHCNAKFTKYKDYVKHLKKMCKEDYDYCH